MVILGDNSVAVIGLDLGILIEAFWVFGGWERRGGIEGEKRENKRTEKDEKGKGKGNREKKKFTPKWHNFRLSMAHNGCVIKQNLNPCKF